MFAQTEWMVGFWLLPVILFIVVPLALLVVWGATRGALKAGQKSRELYDNQKEREQQRASENLEPNATA